MQQKIINLGVSDFPSSFHSSNSPTPNHPKNLSANILQKNKAHTPLIIKTEPTHSTSNNANSNLLGEKNLPRVENINLINNIPNTNLYNENGSNNQFNIGRWTEEEHNKFIEGILEYGNEWKKVQQIIKTRSSTQARSHAQKFFLRVKKIIKLNGGSFNINEKEKILENIINNILPNKRAESLTKNQKEKLLSAISSNIKYEGEINEQSEDEHQLVLDEDNLNYKKEYKEAEDDIIVKNPKNSINLGNSHKNSNIFSQRKISIGQKRKKSDSKIFFIKKDISHRPSMDFLQQSSDNEDSNLNFLNIINKEYELIQGKNCELNNKKINLGNHNNNDSFENKNIMNGYVINNYINVTNTFLNNKYICNYFNNDIINNSFSYNYNFSSDYNSYNIDKNDSINNERNYSYGFFQGQDKSIFSPVDKPFLNGQFNKTFNNSINYMNRINNENENNINSNPFELNFTNFSCENCNYNENEQQISIHEDEFIKLNNNNTEENID